MRIARPVLLLLLRVILKVAMRLRIRGMERIPEHGPAIILFNHITFVDPVLVTGVLPREGVAMSKVENFSHPVVGPLIRAFGAFPVQRGQVDRRALWKSLEILEKGGVLLMSPEGTRSRTPGLLEGRDGATYVALLSGVPVIPVAVSGAEQFLPNVKRLRRTPAEVSVGRPFRLTAQDGRMSRPKLREMTAEVMYELAKLLPPEYRGVYSDLSLARQDYLEFVDVAGPATRDQR